MEHLRGQQSSDSTCTSIISCDPLFGTDAHNYRPQTKFGARLSFYTCLWFCSRGGEVPGQVPPGRHTPWQVHPQAGTPPRQVHPLAGTPPGRYTPWDQVPHPPDQVHRPTCACWEIRSTSRRYASYWNACLLWPYARKTSSPFNLHSTCGFLHWVIL